ncbi:glycosyltransferase family 39 protein [bacterium]|nr:glycosyltransferase family 39 protein [bacterium]
MIKSDNLLNRFQDLIGRHPLMSLMLIAGILRLLAVIFAKGYMASDDHFLVIEIADGWLNGINRWSVGKPPQRSILYPYSVTAIMWLLKQISVTKPDMVMYVVRFVHALWSMTLIPILYYGVKRFADEKTAFTAGLMGAVFFVMPFMSVRNLVEFVGLPVILAGTLLADMNLKSEERRNSLWLFSGMLLGFAFIIRYQNCTFALGGFIYLLFRREWRGALFFAAGAVSLVILEAVIDVLSYGKLYLPYINLLKYQSEHVNAFVTNPFYVHFGTVLLGFIPPFSLLFIWWAVKGAKKMPVTFWGAFAFLFVHSLIPQKQERFILPILPAVMALGMTGYYYSKLKGKAVTKWFWRWFWAVNTILLIITTFNYSQKARVESMIKLGAIEDARNIVVINTEHPMNPPSYYLGREADITTIYDWDAFYSFADSLENIPMRNINIEPLYFVVYTHKPLNHYLFKMTERFHPLEKIEHIKPSLVDALLHFMNPEHNHSKEAYIFRWEGR